MQNSPVANSRNYGIDALRIISMIMIVILHISGHGGILKNLTPQTPEFYSAWTLEIASYCAVNCYALISGYVGICSKFKYSSIITLTLNVIFYSLGITVLFSAFSNTPLTSESYLHSVFPFAFNVYWYFTAYFCMFFFIPYFNKLINNLDKKDAIKLIASLAIILSVMPVISQFDAAKTNKGYSALWLSALYIIGACIRKFDLCVNLKKSTLSAIYLICTAINCAVKFLTENFPTNSVYLTKASNNIISYCSPTIVISAISLLVLFSKINFGKKASKVISFFAPLSFGVYLIHDEPLIRTAFIENRFADFTQLGPVGILFATVLSAVSIWLICSLIDKLRLILFKVARTKQFSEKITEKL